MKEAGEKRGENVLLGVSSVWKNSGNFERYRKSYLLSVMQCSNA
jgi:hypothetical protein